MEVGDERARLAAATDQAAASDIAPLLAAGESVWATVPGAGGDRLVATDLRLLHVRRGPDGGTTCHAWPFEELSEIRPLGGRPGETPGRFVIHDASRSAPLIAFAIDPARREDAMQAVTIVQLLIARARRHHGGLPAGGLRETVDAAVARARAARREDGPGQSSPPQRAPEAAREAAARHAAAGHAAAREAARESGEGADARPPEPINPRSEAPTRHSPR